MCSCLFPLTEKWGKKKSLEIFGPGFTFCMKIVLLVILYLKIDWNRLSLLFSSTPQPRGREMRSALCSQFFSWLYFCLTLILSLCVYKMGTLLAERNWAILITVLRNTTVSQYIQYSCLAHHMEWPSLGITEEEKGKDWNGKKDGDCLISRHIFWRSQGAPRIEGKQLIKIVCQNKLADEAEMPEDEKGKLHVRNNFCHCMLWH